MSDSIAIWAMIRNEEAWIAQWIRYHRALGVERFFIHAHRCTDRTVEIASAFPEVTVTEIERLNGESLAASQARAAANALNDARAESIKWLLGIDVDEFAWGGSTEHLSNIGSPHEAVRAGHLEQLVEHTDDHVEQVRLATYEVVPTATPAGRSTFRDSWLQIGRPFVRALADPVTGQRHLTNRFLGHQFGKSMVRTSADLKPKSPHDWQRSDGSDPTTIERGCHLHYFVGSYNAWTRKCSQWGEHGDTWDGTIPRPFPRNEWRDFVASAKPNEVQHYFDTAVLVKPEILEPFRGDRLFPTSVVAEVLDTTKPNGGRKLAFIGLDCFDHEIAEEMFVAGELPALASVVERSAEIRTIGPPGTFVNNTWPDLYSGVGAAKHGTVCWKQRTPGTYDFDWRHIRTSQTRRVIWDALADAGYRTAVVDAPLTPGWPANGLQVFEWGSHDPELGFAAWPKALEAEITDLVGEHAVGGHCNQHDRTPADIVDFRDGLIDGADRRARLFPTMYERDDWDLYFAVYSESHCVGHQAWHYHDPSSPKFDLDAATNVGDVVGAVYRAIDRSLKTVLEAIDEDTTVLVWMTHGMGNHTYPTYLNDEILLALDRGRRARDADRLNALARIRGDKPSEPGRPEPEKDDRGSRLFYDQLNNDPESGIRLNVRGREPAGLVEPGQQYEELCDWLIEQYLQLTDAHTGEPLVDDVFRSRDHYEGPYIDDLPDLFVQWRRGSTYVTEVNSPSAPEPIRGAPYSCRTGDHHPNGRLYAYGPGIEPGPVEQNDPLLSRDVTALLLDFFDVEMNIDGVVPRAVSDRIVTRSTAS